MKKRVVSVLLAMALLVGILPVGVLSVGAYSATDIPYAVEGGNIYFDKATGAVTDCDASVTAANIPAEIDGVAVTSIGNYAFYSCDSLMSVTIPDSVTSIEESAFHWCYSLTSVTIPDSVTSIGDGAFSYCDNLTSVTIPDSVTSIGYRAFSYCDSLSGIWVDEENENYSSDESGVLFNKDKTTLIQCPGGYSGSYTIPDSVTSIGGSAFDGCYSLTSVTIPDSVTSIGYWAFYSCTSLSGIWVDEENENYSSDESGVLFNKDKTTLIQCPGGYSGSYTIPDSVTSIGNDAFAFCYSLTSVTIGNGVTSIGNDAFHSCDSLTSVTILNPDCTIYGSNLGVAGTTVIYGYEDSTAQTYAGTYGFAFVAIEDSGASDGETGNASGFPIAEFETSTYKIFNNAASWIEAALYCESIGGHLATIASLEENGFIYNYITQNNVSSAYFGFSDAETEGVWEWVTGEDVNYTNWHSGEPNHENTNEDYAMFYYKFSDGTWNDGKFGSGSYYICEWDSSEDNDPSIFLENTYKADIWLNLHSDHNATLEAEVIDDVLSFYSLSTEMCEMLNDDRRFQNALGAWQALQVVFDPVSATDDLYLSQEDIYETLILDFLKKSTEKDEEMAKNIILQSVDALGTDGKTVTKYKKIVDNIVTMVDAPVDALLETLKTYKFDPDNSTFTEFYASLNNTNDSLGEMWTDNEFIEDVSTIANVATDLKDFFMRLTAYMIAYDLSNEMVALLTEMRNQTANDHFKLALTDVINAVDHASYVAIICSLDLAQDTTIAFLDKCFDEVTKGIPVYNVLSLGYKAGKAFSDLVLNTSNLIDSYYLLEATKNFVAANRAAITVLENRYRYSGTEADAAAYVLAIESYCDVIEIDLASGIQFAKSSTEDGLLNWKKNIEASVISFIFGREYTTSYDRLVESRDEILQSLAIIFDHLENSWKYNEEYLKTDYPAVYPIYVAKDFSQEVYTPVILSTMLNRSGESMITWQVPGCYTDKTGVTHTLYGSLIMDGAELTETVESHTQTVTVPLAAEKNTTALYNEEKFTVFPKEYSVRAFTNTDLGKVYTNAAKERMTSPCKPVTLTITKEGTKLLIGIYDPSSCYYENVKYYILRKETGTDTYEEILTLEREFLLDGRTTYIRDLTAQEGVSYTYMVISEMTFNNGKKLTSSSVNELGLVFSRGGNPQPLTIRDNLNHCTARKSGSVAEGIDLSWDVVDHVDGYRIYRKACYGSNFQLIADVGSEISEYLDTTAEAGVGYEYFLVPYSLIGEEESFNAAASFAGELVIEEDEEGISHSYTATIIAPTCTEQGYTLYTCTCGDSYKDTYTDPLGHSYEAVVTDPTCTEAGFTTYTCGSCGDSYVTDEVEALGHNYEAVVTEPTCTEAGFTTYTCSVCGDRYVADEVEALGHNYETIVTEPTCTESGFTTYTCAFCGDSYIADETVALGHAWDDGTVTIEPTATEAGVMTYTCTREGCGETKTEEIPALDEDPDEPCDGGEDCPSAHFTDIHVTYWYHEAVDFAVENGLFGGMSENTFEPNTAMTRAMLVTVLWRYAGKPAEGENTFTDVPAGLWYTDAVAWAAHNNIVSGVGDNKFDPNGNITREQMATILYRYAGGKDIDTSARADLSSFPDAGNVSGYALDAMKWAVAEGLIKGSDGKLLPQGNATRAQVATILMRFIENVMK